VLDGPRVASLRRGPRAISPPPAAPGWPAGSRTWRPASCAPRPAPR